MQLFALMLTNTLLMTLLTVLYLVFRVPLLRHVKPATCYILGIIIIVGMLIPLRPILPISLIPTTTPIQQLATTDLGLPDSQSFDYDLTAEDHQQLLTQALLSSKPASPGPSASASISTEPWRIFAYIWLSGIVLLFLYHAMLHLRFRRLIQRWQSEPDSIQLQVFQTACTLLRIQKPPHLWQCSVIESPMLVGIFRPIVLLPMQPFSIYDLNVILQHELVHHRRRDLWYKALVLASVCLHWWNPLVRQLARVISTDCEMSCDDIVLLSADLTQRKRYGETILSAIARQTTPHVALSTCFYERRIDMRQRFESMLNMCPKRAGKLLIVICFCITLLIGSVFATSETIPVISATQTLSPTTGMLYPAGRDDTYRPVLIEISNSKGARPPLAISLADIVYEYIFWGPGNTRYLALYNDYHPEMVGAIRSSRSSSISLRNSWDCPIVYWGEENNLPEISVNRAMATNGVPQSMQFDGTDTNLNSIFSRTTMRESPHNAVANLQVVVEENWPTDAAGTQYEPALPTLHFSSKPTQSGAPVTEISIPYDEQDSAVRYIYDVAEGHYKRWQNGSPQFDGLTGQRIIADNVVVLYAELAFYDNNISQPLWNFTGEGKLDVFISGRHIHGTWLRAEETSTFEYFEENGNSLLLKPGKTFIQIVPLGMKIELSD